MKSKQRSSLSIFSSLITILFVGCATTTSPRGGTKFFRAYPAKWDSSLDSYVSDLGEDFDLTAHQGAGGVFKKEKRKQVEKFVKQFGRECLFSDPYYYPKEWENRSDGKAIVPEGVDTAVVMRRDIFEIEPMMAAMARSGLFELVFPAAEGLGDGDVTIHVGDRGAFFVDPQQPSSDQVIAKLEGFFADCYRNRTPNPTIRVVSTRPEDYDFEVTVSNLKNFVIPRANYWEELDIRVWISPVFGQEKNGLMVHLETDGRYASGIRDTPPPPKKFKDLELEFNSNLQDTAESFGDQFRRYFKTTKIE